MKKICVITGATSGIGFTVAHELAAHDFDLVVVGRSMEKGEILVAGIRERYPDVKVDYRIADLSEMGQVEEVGRKIAQAYPIIDVLINNAGAVYSGFSLTSDGIERTIANNHLSYFVLTGILLRSVRRAASGRIIIVSSGSHYRGRLKIDSFTRNMRYNIMKSYAQSKLANVMFMHALARRMEGSQVRVNALHPGVVRTQIGSKAENWLHKVIWTLFARRRGISTAESAKTYIYLAADEDGTKYHGSYFHNGTLKEPSSESRNIELQEQLWKWSTEVSGIDYDLDEQ